MSPLATEKNGRSRQARRSVIVYLAVSAFCVMVDKIYAIFGHGVYSASMYLMYLYPLLGGVLPFCLLWLFIPLADHVDHYRLIYNGYNSGIAILTIGSLLEGIFEIAGTSSPYVIVIIVCGWILVAAGLSAYLLMLSRNSRHSQRLPEKGQPRNCDVHSDHDQHQDRHGAMRI